MTLPLTKADYYEAERLVLEGKTARGLRRMATCLERLGKPYNQARVEAFRAFADSLDKAPRHNGKPCLTFAVYGNCPPWPH